MSGPSLARIYCYGADDFGYGYDAMTIEHNDGEHYRIDDVHAILETLRAIEAGRECDDICVSLRVDMKCDCLHGRMMAVIDEALK